MNRLVRMIPAVHEFQKRKEFQDLMRDAGVDENLLTSRIKQQLDCVRRQVLNDTWNGALPGSEAFFDKIIQAAAAELQKSFTYNLKRVINATGIVLHTNLGRARLSEEVLKHVTDIAGNYSNLEYRLEEGERGSRHDHIEEWICEITGAEAAMAVNNNAAAVFLVLRAFGKDREVIVSRGQLVEIGGSFRISSIMEESGAFLKEVGTTNKTRIADYREAVTENTAMLLKVHTSNFKLVGFTESVSTEELAMLAREMAGLVFYEDLGSGMLHDLPAAGIGSEPLIKEVLGAGADLVSFSGDKLLGGPQAGIIAGRKKYIEVLKKHQLARVLRVDKMTLAALEASLSEYRKGNAAMRQNPALRDILTEPAVLEKRAEAFCKQLEDSVELYARVMQSTSMIGGGTMPGEEIPTWGVSVSHMTISAEALHRALRSSDVPVITRIIKDEIFFDVRTMTDRETAEAAAILIKLIREIGTFT
ncbi:L-seryl-tRNA(Sec) selenium transferase [Peribacillus sp. SCS-37]|uniref:L-seryl-tRNA(Sec) selenium transferase n=1 Tax=Paraperibacillus esterisolvens TaxID=3115296 RepID=UPI0039065106